MDDWNSLNARLNQAIKEARVMAAWAWSPNLDRIEHGQDARGVCRAMTAALIDGKAVAADIYAKVAAEVRLLSARHGVVPGLAVVLIGRDPASEIYVGSKKKMTAQVGMCSFDHRLPETASEAELLALLARLNGDPAVHGILVQLPLPPQIDPYKVIAAIDPGKDVDGFHPMNVGRLALGLPSLVPCTPLGCIALAGTVHASFAGLDAVVIGRSSNLGRPLAQLLIGRSATVTVAHSKTRDLPGICRRADLVVAAVGRPELVRADWIKPGATVIDVGINRVSAGDRYRIVGDVAFAEAVKVAGAITPVPGGVGPMTIACLLANTVRATCAAFGFAEPALSLE
jgi:methylenetetrahydrofolate dehydrogenase (NADP+) / methenyltetrahydrofolate cyclohydrolase